MKLSPGEIAYVARWAGFTDAELPTAVAVCLAESNGDTDIIGPATLTGPSAGNRDHGLWQISNRWHGDKLSVTPNWRSPYVNARLARRIYLDAGSKWTPWHVYTSDDPKNPGHKVYERHLAEAEVGCRWPFKPATLGDRL